ncbi:MAG: NTP transferase domain-containing protein [Candidatus Promineifilaceae bacterium]
MIIWAIIPVKPLRYGKSRLSHILSADERAALTRSMLGHTLEVLEGVKSIFRTLVVSRDPAVLKVARQYGALTFSESDKQDLNMALTRATHIAIAQQANSVLILPSDLPFLTSADVEMMINGVGSNGRNGNGNGYHLQNRAITICSDHNEEGTNALVLSPPTGFTFRFGENSFQRHLDEAERLGMTRRIIHAPGIKFDLDTMEDWKTYVAMNPQPVLEMA